MARGPTSRPDLALTPCQLLTLLTWFLLQALTPGANDSVLPDAEQLVSQHVPIQEYEANLRFFLDQLTSPSSPYAVARTPGLNIVLITPPPLLVSMMGDTPFSRERVPATTKAYADVVLRLGEEYAAKATLGGNWRVGTVNMWDATIAAAGGEGDELAKYLR